MLSVSLFIIGNAVAVTFAGKPFVDPFYAGKNDYYVPSRDDAPPPAVEDYFLPSHDSPIRPSPSPLPQPVPPPSYRVPGRSAPSYNNPAPAPPSYGSPPSSSNYGNPPPVPSGYGYPQPASSGYGYPPPAPSGYGYPPPAPSGYGSPTQDFDGGFPFSRKSSERYMIHPGLHKMPYYPSRKGKRAGRSHY